MLPGLSGFMMRIIQQVEYECEDVFINKRHLRTKQRTKEEAAVASEGKRRSRRRGRLKLRRRRRLRSIRGLTRSRRSRPETLKLKMCVAVFDEQA